MTQDVTVAFAAEVADFDERLDHLEASQRALELELEQLKAENAWLLQQLAALIRYEAVE